MSTRSSIGIKRKDGTIECIYCHSDGYLEYNGKLLHDFYKDPNKVSNLINLGDISLLNQYVNPDPDLPHSFDYNERQEGVVVAYGRDRGELNYQSKKFDNITDYRNSFYNSWQEFAYLYDEENKEWLWSSIPYENVEDMNFTSLEDKLKELNLIEEKDSKLDNLVNRLNEYTKNKDLYLYKDAYESEEDAINDLYDCMITEKGINNIIDELCVDLSDLACRQDLSDIDDNELFDTTTNLIKDMSQYKSELKLENKVESDIEI